MIIQTFQWRRCNPSRESQVENNEEAKPVCAHDMLIIERASKDRRKNICYAAHSDSLLTSLSSSIDTEFLEGGAMS